jgi:glutamate dehydrogenase
LYTRLFDFFSLRPELCLQVPFRQAITSHLPRILQETPQYRQRVSKLPQKYLCAILASEIASSLVYSGSSDADFEDMIRRHLARVL